MSTHSLLNKNYPPNPQVWVGCLAAYNQGDLHGEWIECSYGSEHINERIAHIIKTSPAADAEEWLIFDQQDMGDIGENESPKYLAEVAEFILEHDELALICLDNVHGNLKEAESMIENYYGCYQSQEEFGWEMLENQGIEIPDALLWYFDAKAYGRDLLTSYDAILSDGKIYVFDY